jgi:hypothetical protein
MSGRKKEFKRIATGSGRIRVSGRQALWLGRDHLLLVDSFILVEQYQRFFFSDVQAIVIQRTIAWPLWNLLFAGMAALFGAQIWLRRSDGVSMAVFGCCAGYFLLALALNLLMGPTCRCRIQTAGGEKLLSCVGRLRKARKLVRILRPLIEQVQPPLQAEERAALDAEELPPSMIAVETAKPVEIWTHAGWAHYLMFSLLFLFGLLDLGTVFCANLSVAIVKIAVFLALVIAATATLIRQHIKNPETAIVKMSRMALAVILLAAAIGYVSMILAVTSHPEMARDPLVIVKSVAAKPALDSFFGLFSNAILGVASLALGGVGLYASRNGWRVPFAPPPFPPTAGG